jgi:archaemetzincin
VTPERTLEIRIVPVGGARVPPWLSPELAWRFGARVGPGEPLPARDEWVDGERGQMLSSAVVDVLIDRATRELSDPERQWLLGVADTDLYAPGLSFVFGEATVGGCCAVISLARLRADGGRDPARFRRRVLTEAVHELGHVAGLSHCSNAGCVMSSSETLSDTDRKGCEPCRACAVVFQRLGAKDSA